jgi:hypothetical protein
MNRGKASKDHSHEYTQGRGPSKGHKTNPQALPSGRNSGQKMAADVPHDYSPGPGSPVPTDSNAR